MIDTKKTTKKNEEEETEKESCRDMMLAIQNENQEVLDERTNQLNS